MIVRLCPLDNLKKSTLELYEWNATNMDPQFLIEGYSNLLGKNINLVLRIEADKKLIFGPKIYWGTFSEPISELNSLDFELKNDGSYFLNLTIKKDVNFLRLDPMGVSCNFNINELSCNGENSLFIENESSRLIKNYSNFIKEFEINDSKYQSLKEEIDKWPFAPKISIVLPTYNTPLKFIKNAINSVLNQVYKNWELIIVDDASQDSVLQNYLNELSNIDNRISFIQRENNGHISTATNTGIANTNSNFIGFLDHDDELHPLALYYVVKELIANPNAILVYTDEDFIGENGGRYSPYFKCDFNYDLLLSHNMITHFSVYSKKALLEVGLFNTELDGAQDYDMVLRIFEKYGDSNFIHIPRVLYHWRVHEQSSSSSIEAKPYAHLAAIKAIQNHLNRIGVDGIVSAAPEVVGCNRVSYGLPKEMPSVEIIILTKDSVHLLRTCIESIINKSTFTNYIITIVDNGSSQKETIDYFSSLSKFNFIKIYRDDSEFNFSALNNCAVNKSSADFVLLLNNDIEVITPNWIEEMLGLAIQEKVGCVGARLWYPNDTLQHGGLIMGLGGVAGHSHKFLPKGEFGYANRAALIQSLCGVTAACLLIKREKYLSVGGMDEDFKVAFNDVDFCLRVLKDGNRNIWTPYAELYHHESATRGYENTPEKKLRFHNEALRLRELWEEILNSDPYYSPNLSISTEDFSIAWPPRV